MSNSHSSWIWKSEGLQSHGIHGKAVVTAHKTLVISISGESPLNIEQQLDDLFAVLEEEILCLRKRNKTVHFKFFFFFFFFLFSPCKDFKPSKLIFVGLY